MRNWALAWSLPIRRQDPAGGMVWQGGIKT